MTLDNFIQKVLSDICKGVSDANTKSKFQQDEYCETDIDFDIALNRKGEINEEYEPPVNRIKFTVHFFKKLKL